MIRYPDAIGIDHDYAVEVCGGPWAEWPQDDVYHALAFGTWLLLRACGAEWDIAVRVWGPNRRLLWSGRSAGW